MNQRYNASKCADEKCVRMQSRVGRELHSGGPISHAVAVGQSFFTTWKGVGFIYSLPRCRCFSIATKLQVAHLLDFAASAFSRVYRSCGPILAFLKKKKKPRVLPKASKRVRKVCVSRCETSAPCPGVTGVLRFRASAEPRSCVRACAYARARVFSVLNPSPGTEKQEISGLSS